MSINRTVEGVNDLATWCMNHNAAFLLSEWDVEKNGTLSPCDVTYASNRKVWWKCVKGHSYVAQIGNRTYKGNGCPYCSGHKTLAGFNDLQSWCKSNGFDHLLVEWDYEKNTIKPTEISPKNNKKVWWKCSLGHSWEANIGSRTKEVRPSGCPYCSIPPKKILEGVNDFEFWCIKNNKEELLHEWSRDKNGELQPKEVFYGSGKRVWWKCNRGHDWYVSVASRVQGTGCPICARTQTSFPEQAIAYYLSKTFDITQRFRRKGFEIDAYLNDYKIGIEYDGAFFHTKESKEHEEEKDSFYREHNIRLIHIKENKRINGFEGDTLYFKVGKSNYLDSNFNTMLVDLLSYIAKITGVRVDKDIDIVRDQLEVRKQYASIKKNNSFATVFPELVSEWDIEKNNGMTPDHFSAYSQTKVWWRCSRGHSWNAAISSRYRLGCPYCAGQRVIVGENDLASWCEENNPELLLEWNYDKNDVLPTEIMKTSNKKVWWKCTVGHEWEAVVANRVHGTRCPACYTGRETDRLKMSFSTWCNENNMNQLLSEWNYDKNGSLLPENITKGSHRKVWWICSKGHEWEAEVKSRTYNHGCPFCSGTYKKAVLGENDLVTWCKNNNKLYILNEWDYNSNAGMQPESFTFGSHKRINWICAKGHRWSAVIKDRTKIKGNRCPICRNENDENE